jgi:hypothetical protein
MFSTPRQLQVLAAARRMLFLTLLCVSPNLGYTQTSPPPVFFIVNSSLEIETIIGSTYGTQVLKQAQYSSSTGGGTLVATGLTPQQGSTSHSTTITFSDTTLSGSLSTNLSYSAAAPVPGQTEFADTIIGISLWILGPPGTPFDYTYAATGSVSASNIGTQFFNADARIWPPLATTACCSGIPVSIASVQGGVV